ncbi:helix-turn-helix domain-containing protein [Listeria fleischmannii]|uniref:HTH-type transcriptional regulator AnsR n=1 Tax=Listeria fleischmannii FSL S10-1203 TaxID=1265822 RepID=W7DXV4_9LIST|nr:helix-turn-helix transcriptional regulator [Listeria fleischmannii]EUJ53509.1 HTH-type transcriptional regulator AnsR [Listeria fleischmannii FSL S10-1203]MBC1418451.1 helix-turn-helix transcriptional regulator [Listeria fleischmannii]
MAKLSERLKFLREKKNWSKVQTAKYLGLKAPSTYGNWEYGLREPDLEMVAKIALLYGVSIDYLLGENDLPTYELLHHKTSPDISIYIEAICDKLKTQTNLFLGKKELSEATQDYLVESLHFSLKQAEKLNKL